MIRLWRDCQNGGWIRSLSGIAARPTGSQGRVWRVVCLHYMYSTILWINLSSSVLQCLGRVKVWLNFENFVSLSQCIDSSSRARKCADPSSWRQRHQIRIAPLDMNSHESVVGFGVFQLDINSSSFNCRIARIEGNSHKLYWVCLNQKCDEK